MNVETSVSVYSLVTDTSEATGPESFAIAKSRRRIEAYLYGHTTIVDSYDGGKYVFHIVKTTVNLDVDSETKQPTHTSDRDAVREAFFLANYQLNRFSSGLIGGILAGSRNEAQALLAETVGALS